MHCLATILKWHGSRSWSGLAGLAVWPPYESFLIEQGSDRLGYRDRVGDAAPNTRVLEVREL